jgi:uncharacterized protein YjbI with pentapeptide repeats
MHKGSFVAVCLACAGHSQIVRTQNSHEQVSEDAHLHLESLATMLLASVPNSPSKGQHLNSARGKHELTSFQQARRAGIGFIIASHGLVQPALADGDTTTFKFPPVNENNLASRCKFTSSSMGQANAARDELFDLRICKMGGQDANGGDLSGALMAKGDFSKVNFKEAQLSKVYAEGANFDGADFTDGVLDRGYYKDASFVGTKFNNAVLSGSNFEGADLTNSDWTDASMGFTDQKRLCKNPTLKGEHPVTGAPTRESAGCIGAPPS